MSVTSLKNIKECKTALKSQFDSLLVHDENHGLGLYMWGIASGSVGHRVSLEYGLGVSHRVGHGFGHGVVHGVSQFKSSF